MFVLDLQSAWSAPAGGCPPEAIVQAARARGLSGFGLADVGDAAWPQLQARAGAAGLEVIRGSRLQDGDYEWVVYPLTRSGLQALPNLRAADLPARRNDYCVLLQVHGAVPSREQLAFWTQQMGAAFHLAIPGPWSLELARLGRALGVPIVLAPPVYFVRAEDALVHRLLVLIRGDHEREMQAPRPGQPPQSMPTWLTQCGRHNSLEGAPLAHPRDAAIGTERLFRRVHAAQAELWKPDTTDLRLSPRVTADVVTQFRAVFASLDDQLCSAEVQAGDAWQSCAPEALVDRLTTAAGPMAVRVHLPAGRTASFLAALDAAGALAPREEVTLTPAAAEQWVGDCCRRGGRRARAILGYQSSSGLYGAKGVAQRLAGACLGVRTSLTVRLLRDDCTTLAIYVEGSAALELLEDVQGGQHLSALQRADIEATSLTAGCRRALLQLVEGPLRTSDGLAQSIARHAPTSVAGVARSLEAAAPPIDPARATNLNAHTCQTTTLLEPKAGFVARAVHLVAAANALQRDPARFARAVLARTPVARRQRALAWCLRHRLLTVSEVKRWAARAARRDLVSEAMMGAPTFAPFAEGLGPRPTAPTFALDGPKLRPTTPTFAPGRKRRSATRVGEVDQRLPRLRLWLPPHFQGEAVLADLLSQVPGPCEVVVTGPGASRALRRRLAGIRVDLAPGLMTELRCRLTGGDVRLILGEWRRRIEPECEVVERALAG